MRIDVLVSKIERDRIASGNTLYYDDSGKVLFGVPFVSGGTGRTNKGYLLFGEWKVTALEYTDDPAMKMFDFGFFARLEQQFKDDTKRTGIGIHPLGSKWKQTQGCVGEEFASLNDAIKCRNLIRDALDKKENIVVNVLNVLEGRKC